MFATLVAAQLEPTYDKRLGTKKVGVLHCHDEVIRRLESVKEVCCHNPLTIAAPLLPLHLLLISS